jgi:hypothetical protein
LKLLTTGNAKTVKGQKKGYLTFILHLAPSDSAGCGNVCPKATAGCIAACLNLAGRGGMFTPEQGTNAIQEARKRKTRLFFNDRDTFMEQLEQDINLAIKQAARKDMIPAIRLNGTSDLSWEKYKCKGSDRNLFEMFDNVQFYDYTKVLGRKVDKYKNYHLTFSRAESNDKDCAKALKQGMNVAAVYDQIPAGMYSADETDLRFLDPVKGQTIGLKVKGHRAKKDTSGFVIRTKSTV